MAKALFHLSRVTKQYNGKEVLNIEELDIYEGEILGIMGPRGAGKTTLLKLLNFLFCGGEAARSLSQSDSSFS